MVDIVTRINNVVNGFVWGPFGLALLFCTGLWLSIRTGFFQFRRMGYWLRHTIGAIFTLSLIHISEPTRRTPISYAVFCLKKKKARIWYAGVCVRMKNYRVYSR